MGSLGQHEKEASRSEWVLPPHVGEKKGGRPGRPEKKKGDQKSIFKERVDLEQREGWFAETKKDSNGKGKTLARCENPVQVGNRKGGGDGEGLVNQRGKRRGSITSKDGKKNDGDNAPE